MNSNFGNYLKLIKKRRSFVCGIKGHVLSKKEILFIKKYKPWGIILFSRNIKSLKQTQNLTKSIRKIYNDQFFPIIIDEEGGRVSRLKNIIDNSKFTPEFFGKIYSRNKNKFKLFLEIYINQVAYLLKTMGININSVPVLDIKRKKYHKIISDRAFSNRPETISKIGDIVINTFHEMKILTIMKHIPGHGLAKSDSHKSLPVVLNKRRYLFKNDFITFKKKKSLMAMTAHVLYKDIDRKNCATHSENIIKIIRNQIGFKNIIITDDISMKALKYSLQINTRKAFSSGCNLVLHCNGKMSEMLIVGKNSPILDKFLSKKTSEIYKVLS
ncbi:MAG: glycosyl hydrolase [Candidatus Pelagibacter sp.]|nr:glycosyl hydrolase [Candidatus Pelagibacter sp.]